ncbi:MAG: hypothetical protein AAF570_13710, partial [Bacteroidota bacterium]
LALPAGKANPAPPVGTALGQHGVNIMEFCKAFNAKTQKDHEPGMKLPVIITVFQDKSFEFIIKSPPAAVLLLKAAGLKKGLISALLFRWSHHFLLHLIHNPSRSACKSPRAQRPTLFLFFSYVNSF